MRYPPRSAECDQVSEAPDVRSRAVFRRGISQGFLVSIPLAGQTAPIEGDGLRLT